MLTRTMQNVSIILQQGNIVAIEADAIVNAANSALAGGGGVDGAIHQAGGPSIMQECRKIGGCPTGNAVATRAGNLKAKYIFHAVGPIYGYHGNEEQLLAATYRSCLELAEQYQCQSIAFPSISTGAYSYPVHLAAPIALGTVIEHLKQPTSLQQITFVLFGQQTYDAYEQALKDILPA
jgi:O-acetyl-ADP-ribose deacetylase (regulator of RNase III)